MRPCGLELHIPCPVEQESSNAQNENWLLQSGSHNAFYQWWSGAGCQVVTMF